MTETELIDRLREAIVLDGPDVWRTNGYLQEAQQAGVPLADALKRASEISQEVAGNKLLFQNILDRIARLGEPSRTQFINQDLNKIVNAASSLNLSPDFVKNQWVPTVLQRVAATKTPPTPSVVESPSEPTPVEELINTTPRSIEPETPPEEPVQIVPEPVVPLPVVDKPVIRQPPLPPSPPPIVHKFTATPAHVRKGEPVTLEWDVENLLAVTIDDLGEGLSPKNRGWVKPSKTADYTLFDVNNNPLSTVRIEVEKPDRSGIYGVLFAAALLLVIYWFIKSSGSPRPERDRSTDQKTEQTTPSKKKRSAESETENKPATSQTSRASEETDVATDTAPSVAKTENDKPAAGSTPPIEPPAPNETAPPPASPADARQGKYKEEFGNKPYDKVELGADERGWRRARKNGRWGYINEADEWVIEPEYEAVTPFRGSTASVFLNGQLMVINREGEQVRN